MFSWVIRDILERGCMSATKGEVGGKSNTYILNDIVLHGHKLRGAQLPASSGIEFVRPAWLESGLYCPIETAGFSFTHKMALHSIGINDQSRPWQGMDNQRGVSAPQNKRHKTSLQNVALDSAFLAYKLAPNGFGVYVLACSKRARLQEFRGYSTRAYYNRRWSCSEGPNSFRYCQTINHLPCPKAMWAWTWLTATSRFGSHSGIV